METSYLLARVIGPYMLIAGFAMFLNRANMKKLLDEFPNNDVMTFVMGAVALILGLLMLQFHNIWVMDWRVLVTLIAWITTIKGVTVMLYPDAMIKLAGIYKNNDMALNIQAVIAILFGLYMGYIGYFA